MIKNCKPSFALFKTNFNINLINLLTKKLNIICFLILKLDKLAIYTKF